MVQGSLDVLGQPDVYRHTAAGDILARRKVQVALPAFNRAPVALPVYCRTDGNDLPRATGPTACATDRRPHHAWLKAVPDDRGLSAACLRFAAGAESRLCQCAL